MLHNTCVRSPHIRTDTLVRMRRAHETIGDRVRIARTTRNLSVIDLAKRSGLTRSALYQIESGVTRSPTPANLLAIAKATGYSLEWLTSGAGIPEAGTRTREEDNLPTVSLPMLTTRQTNDGRLLWGPDHDRSLTIHRSLLEAAGQPAGDMLWHKVLDDSMSPSIAPGDVVLIDTADARLRTSKVFAMPMHGELIVRRTHMEADGAIMLSADNQRVRPVRVEPQYLGTITMIGRIRCRISSADL